MNIKCIYKIGGMLTIACAALLLILRIVTPFIKIDNAQIIWEGWQPGIQLHDFTVTEPFEAHFKQVTIILNWSESLLKREWRFKKIKVKGVSTNFPFEPNAMPLLDLSLWHTVQKILRDNWKRCPIFIFEDVNIGPVRKTRFILTFGETLNVRGVGQFINIDPIDINFGVILKKWMLDTDEIDGLLYLNIFGLPLVNVVPNIDKGKITLEAWVFLKDNEPIRGAIQFEGFNIQTKDIDHSEYLDYLKGNLSFTKNNNDFELWANNFHFIRSDEARQYIEKTLPTEFNLKLSNDNIEFIAHDLALSDWRPFLSSFVFLPKPLKLLLTEYDPEGYLNFLHFQVDSQYKPLFVRGQVDNLSLQSNKNPGFKGLSSVFVYKNNIGRADIKGDNLSLNYPSLFDSKINLKKSSAKIWWQENFPEYGRTIWVESAEGILKKAPFFASMKYIMQSDSEINLRAEVNNILMENFKKLLPKRLNHPLISWLESALNDGAIESLKLKLNGPIKKIPFVKKEGILNLDIKFKDLSLAYAPEWPSLSALMGTINVDRHTLSIHAVEGRIADSPLQAYAWITDLTAPIHNLKLQAEVQSSLEKGWWVVQNSPLMKTVGKTLAPFSILGPMLLSLKLDVPLTQNHDLKTDVKGVINVQNGTFKLNDLDLNINNLKGDLRFTSNDLEAPCLRGKLLGSDTIFSVKSDMQSPYSQLQVKALGVIYPKYIAEWSKLNISELIVGETPYEANLFFSLNDDQKEGSLKIISNLQGLEINLPEPLGKMKNEIHDSEFNLFLEQNGFVRFKGQYGEHVSVAFSLTEKDNEWFPLGGHLYFGLSDTAKYREDGVFQIEGDVIKLDLLEWRKTAHAGVELETRLDLDVGLMRIGNFDFEKVKLQSRYNPDIQTMLYHFNSKMIDGVVTVPENLNENIKVDFERLVLVSKDNIKNIKKDNDSERMTRTISSHIKELNYNGKWINDFRFQLKGDGLGYDFQNVKGRTYQAFFKGSGHFEAGHVNLNGSITSKNFTNMLDQWGYHSSVKDARGKVLFDLDWLNVKDGIDFNTLNGSLELNFNKGYIHGIDPGLGRILSLISLDSIQRRLQLDFSDLSKNGLSFDKMSGKFKLKSGTVFTNDLYLDGSAARLEFDALINLATKQIEADVGVMPNLTAGLPIAVAIAAGNPAVGAAVWVVDKLIGKQIKKINRYEYNVSGTLTDPKISEKKRL